MRVLVLRDLVKPNRLETNTSVTHNTEPTSASVVVLDQVDH